MTLAAWPLIRPAAGLAGTTAVAAGACGSASASQAAKVAGLSIEEFVALLGEAGIPAVDYAPDELKEEAHRGKVEL